MGAGTAMAIGVATEARSPSVSGPAVGRYAVRVDGRPTDAKFVVVAPSG